jgi:cyclic beta-1,2-glucan synthetase
MDSGVLLSYFARKDEARGAIRELRKKGFHRVALVHKTAHGDIRTLDPFFWRRVLGVTFTAVLFGGLAGVAALVFRWPQMVLAGTILKLTSILLGGLTGGFLSWLWIRRSKYGINLILLKNHARWLVSDETVLVLQAPLETLRYAVAVQRESSDIPPTVFVLHPKRERRRDARRPGVFLSPTQIQEHAQRLAISHQVDQKPPRNAELLKRFKRTHQWIHQICSDLNEASRLEQSATPVAEWIIDNEFILEGNTRDIQLNLPQRFYRQLPALDSEPYRGLPRIYAMAKELVFHTDLRLDRENILAFIEAYQSESTLSIGELWAAPQMLRIALVESIENLAIKALTDLQELQLADFWANRLIATTRRDPNQLFAILAELAETTPNPTLFFGSQLVSHLYDEAAALVPVQSWLERTIRKSLNDLNQREQSRQTKDQISIGNAFTSLRLLSQLDWREVFEQLSRVEQHLRFDPSGVYPAMDFDTRDRYRRAVEELSRRSGQTEEQVAQTAIEMAKQGQTESSKDERRGHIGAYLIGKGKRELAQRVGCCEAPHSRILQWIYRHHSIVYFAGFSVFTMAFIALIIGFGLRDNPIGVQLFIVLLVLIPTSQLALEVINYFTTRLLPPHVLPKMDFEKSGIPDEFQTLVVVPMMLVDKKTIRTEIEKLEIRYLANKEDNLFFSLFTDYTDSDQVHDEDDERLLQIAIEGLNGLNNRYGGERFFLFHRNLSWSESEQKFIGWERKRGKLEELNCLIDGTRPEDAEPLVMVGDPNHLSDVRFIITLDSDTQLPHSTARRMIETLAHPLNQPRFDAEGRIMSGTYTIIQPRVSLTLPSTSASPFSRLFADAVGIDPYTKAVSDVYQDLTGEGSYHGKGIYDVRAFSRVLSGRFPEECLLSHDLIEGAHVRVGLASDIELYDEFPKGYLMYISRQHRWIRGDWQIADWILPRVPQPAGRREPNPLSLFNRWKIFDNLRRSLNPICSLALLIASWFISSQLVWIITLVVFLQLFFHPLAQHLTMVTSRQGLKSFSFAKTIHDLLRVVADAALLPHQAGLALDAIVRVLYRRLISRRGLLEWTSAQVSRWSTPGRQLLFGVSLALVSIFSMIAGWAVQRWMPSHLAMASPWIILWFFSPLLGWFLMYRPPKIQREKLLPLPDKQFLRKVAHRTWRFFSDFVNEKSSWLPPDNYQVSHQDQLAMRTSPTNIGLWLLSVQAAHDFGYLTFDQVIEKLEHSMQTISKLERFNGHLLNWYDIEKLTPLEPRYVSAVDSGNLLGSLWILENGLDELVREPLIDAKAFEGLHDTAAEIIKLIAERQDIIGVDTPALDELINACDSPPNRIADTLKLLRRAASDVTLLANEAYKSNAVESEAAYWARQMDKQLTAWLELADRYLTWIEILAEKSEDEVAQLVPEAVLAINKSLSQAPSLVDLANGKVQCVRILLSVRGTTPEGTTALLEWLDRIIEAFEHSKWLAGEMLGSVEQLVDNVHDLSESINMRFLYDRKRRLFSIGYNVSEGRLDNSYYDLLASEARFGSYIAIARGDVPIEHWFSMARPYNAIRRRRVLLSWTGTMFEYLMPLIFQRSYRNSLLDKAVHEAVAIQIAYGHKRRVPWGISESAYGDLDLNKTYQYKAFGVPELGLKRGLEEEVVVAPYATLLAVNIAPHETIRNLRRLTHLGLLDKYGFYEAMDFSRRSRRGAKDGVIVRAYMAHHQGMGFLSLSNFLHGNPVPRRFHADPRVRAFEAMLQERIPILPPLHHISMRERVPSLINVGEDAPSVSKFDTPHTRTPKTQMLCNGRYGLMITNAGGGYSQWSGHELTRWRADRTQDPWGTFCYIHEVDSGRLWSNTYNPVGGEVETYNVDFALDRALFRRADHGIQTNTEVIVSPEDDVEIRRITLINLSGRARRLDLTSYVELSMAPHNADRQHPAFNKLFIQTEALPEQQALLAYRRSRKEEDPPIFVAHRFTLEYANDKAFQFETDRRPFIGRGRTLANPMGVFQKLGNNQGFVLDPILSLRQSLTLGPGKSIQVSMVLAAGETRQQVLTLMDKFSDPHAIERAMDFAWASAQLEMRLLRIKADEARRFQELASHLLFPNHLLRPPEDRIEKNSKGQSGLWPYGISGDLPIALITISETRDISLVRQMLHAHAYWRRHGLKADLVILNEEMGGYERPLRERLENLIQTHSIYTGTDQPGGVFLISADQIPAEDLILLMAVACEVLVAARGTLSQQLGVSIEALELPERLVKKSVPREPSPQLPFLELEYFNSLGGFTPDGREYAIYLGPDTHTPAPWVNVIANPTFGTLVSETGSGFTWYGNSQRNRLTQWSNDPVIDPSSEAVYIRDEESGVYWTPTPSPIREKTAYRARHGAGYTVFEHNSNGIEQELTVFVPVNEQGGEPIKLQRLRLRNDSSRNRKLSITYYVEWTLGESRESSQMHVATSWDDEVQTLLAQNRYHPDYGERLAFAALSRPAESYSGDRTAFLGRNRSMGNPKAMQRTRLSGRIGAGFDPCAALQVTLELAPGDTEEINCILGQGESLEEVHKLVLTYRDRLAFETALSQTKAWWDAQLGTIEVHTPEPSADLLINRWLLYQSLSCRIWGRSAFYQSGGAFGFRDQLQDVMAFLYSNPDLAREHILLAARHQFTEGDVQHWWHPPSNAGIRSRISDDLLWLPYVVAQYVRTTGDVDILHANIPFLSAPLLEDDQHEIFLTPDISSESATLFEHCQRAVTHGLTAGPNGLPLMGTGDWNDGMNLVGAGGKGESVWLAWFLVDVLQGMVEMSGLLKLPDLGQTYQEDRNILIKNVERTAWDCDWYLRATFDDGTPVGSSANEEAKIDSLPQSWAWLNGAADKDRAGRALESAWKHLVREDEGLVLLFTPPFDKSMPSPGYIKGYPPGVRENGGQYTHAALWFAMAMARRGDGERAVKMLRMLNPIEHARDPDTVWRYGVEPYVIAADVYRLPERLGQGGWSWYTGAAAWMYRAWVEEVLGLKIRGKQMQVSPVIPGWWEGFSLCYRHGEAIYEIQVENPEKIERGVLWVEMDGQRLRDGVISLERSLVKHRVLVHMGNTE